jgi:hypothetical protein
VGPDLERWLPDPAVRIAHRRRARASPEALWAAARSLRLRDAPTLGRLVRWRIPATPAERTFLELFAGYPFVVLEQGPRSLVSGLCGRIWTLARDYPRISSPDEFRTWRRPGTVKVAFAHWVIERDEGEAEIFSEARVEPVDRAAATRLRLLWTVIGRFEGLIGGEALGVAVRRAEESAGGDAARA